MLRRRFFRALAGLAALGPAATTALLASDSAIRLSDLASSSMRQSPKYVIGVDPASAGGDHHVMVVVEFGTPPSDDLRIVRYYVDGKEVSKEDAPYSLHVNYQSSEVIVFNKEGRNDIQS